MLPTSSSPPATSLHSSSSANSAASAELLRTSAPGPRSVRAAVRRRKAAEEREMRTRRVRAG